MPMWLSVRKRTPPPRYGLRLVVVVPGSIQVSLGPADAVSAGAQWNVVNDGTWLNSGAIASGLNPGPQTIYYKAITGWPAPPNETANLQDGQALQLTRDYTSIGTLSVDTTPVKGEVFVDGADWGVAPQSRSLAAGSHSVSFGDISGYTKPGDQTATVQLNSTTPVTGTDTAGGGTGAAALSVTPSERKAGKDAGTTTVDVSNSGGGTMAWSVQVTDGADWLAIASGSGGSNSGAIDISVSANKGPTRTGTIRVTASGATDSPTDVTVMQSGATCGIGSGLFNTVLFTSLGFLGLTGLKIRYRVACGCR